ncbi:putative cAMP receptor-like protein [Podospora didyma]|uniref:cAMP receptor-like protein n=1 Tax=Podospora didyma TaxID=330526 RepID=A0AAE0U3M0_9PEZI|nr:putative cAMP receptor-like protein [Podospora didyma]
MAMGNLTVFSEGQIRALVILERLGGSLSLISVILIFIAYSVFHRLRTVPNTFLVFASVSNAGASIASIIAYDGVRQGQSSSLCQAQGFLFEMFVQSDPWWSLAMAINVLLVFSRGTSPHTIKKWGWLYCAICYGGPFMVALICLMLRDPDKTLVYGSAGIWCWISNDWNALRIYSYYMLIWICILASLAIYLGIGIHVFRARNKLRQLSGDGFYVRASVDNPIFADRTWGRRSTTTMKDWPLKPNSGGVLFGPGSAHVLMAASISGPFLGSSISRPPWNVHSPTSSPKFHSSAQIMVGSGLSPPPVPSPYLHRRTTSGSVREVLGRFVIEDPVKRAYLRTAVLFALSVLVTWIPSSINRIRGLLYPDSPYPYNVATAAVLPLQGVWNAIIFFVTSWTVFRESLGDMVLRREGVAELIDQRGRRGKTVYSMWQEAEPRDTGLGLGISWGTREARRKDSWDFLDIGTEAHEHSSGEGSKNGMI